MNFMNTVNLAETFASALGPAKRFAARKLTLSLAVGALAFGVSGCGPKAFIKGEYDDVSKENNLNDQWSETDMQKVVQDLVAGMVGHNSIANAKRPPIVMVTKLQNKTSEHIDTQS